MTKPRASRVAGREQGADAAAAKDGAVTRAEFESLQTVTKELHARVEMVGASCDVLSARLEVLASQMGYEDDDSPFGPEIRGLKEELDRIAVLVGGRNKSAPTKRNMTDADALQVLTGDLKEFGHKVAAEKIGLTYAQVYSCRGEFTFKHVHKKLREEKWVNPWAKK